MATDMIHKDEINTNSDLKAPHAAESLQDHTAIGDTHDASLHETNSTFELSRNVHWIEVPRESGDEFLLTGTIVGTFLRSRSEILLIVLFGGGGGRPLTADELIGSGLTLSPRFGAVASIQPSDETSRLFRFRFIVPAGRSFRRMGMRLLNGTGPTTISNLTVARIPNRDALAFSATTGVVSLELLKLLQINMTYTQENYYTLVNAANLFLVEGRNDLDASTSEFVVEALFKFGAISLAAQVSRKRDLIGFPKTGFDNLAVNYNILGQYDFEVCDPCSHIPMHESSSIQRDNLKVLSFFYGTPVYQHNGYSVRTQSIFENTNLEIFPFGRIGYPWAANLVKDAQKHISGRVGEVEYHHRRGEIKNQADIFANIGLAKDEIKKIIAELRPAVVHAASNFTVGLPALFAARECRLPFVYEMRGIWELTAGVGVYGWKENERYAIERKLETFLASHADRVIALTQTQRADLLLRGISPEKIDVIPNHYNGEDEELGDVSLVAELQSKFKGNIVIGYIGSVVNYEGLQHLVEALSRNDPSLDKIVLLVVGDGPYLEQLKAVAAASGIGERIHFLGRVARATAHALYDLVDMCVLPRIDNEVVQLVSPLKLIEILAHGRILLVSDVKAMAELVEEFGYGEIFRAGDIDDLERSLVRLVADIESLKRHYAGARDYVLANQTWKQGGQLWDATILKAVQSYRELALVEPKVPIAQDALRTLAPAAIDVARTECTTMRRVARARLVAGSYDLRLHLPEAFGKIVLLVLIDIKTGVGTQIAATSVPGAQSGNAELRMSVAAESDSTLLFYVLAETGSNIRPTAWRLEADGEVRVALSIEADEILALQIASDDRYDDNLEIRSSYSEVVQFVSSVIPLKGATTNRIFEKFKYSAVTDARYQYINIQPGLTSLPLAIGVRGSVIVEFLPWQREYRRKPVRLQIAAFTRSRPAYRSFHIDLNAGRHNVLLVADLSENLIDGSAIWLKTMVGALASDPRVNVYVVTNSILIPNSISASILSAKNVAKVDIFLPNGRKSAEVLAENISILDRLSGGFDTIIIRGIDVARSVTSRALRARSILYCVGLIKPADVRAEICTNADSLLLMKGYGGTIFQNSLSRDIFLRSCPGYSGACYVIPPSVEISDLAAAAKTWHAPQHSRYIVYAGKPIREYGLLDLLKVMLALRGRAAYRDVRLIVIGNKFAADDQAFQADFYQLVGELGEAIRWIPAASPAEVLSWVRNAQLVWGWRHSEFETSHYEVSTKMIEALASGSPIVLYPSDGNVDVLGRDYVGFARNPEEAAEVVERLLNIEKATFKAELLKIGEDFISDRTYRPLFERFNIPVRGKRILIAAHDFRFIDSLEAALHSAGHRVYRQIWAGHARLAEGSEGESIDGMDIIHCEWCLGNAVYWSTHLPAGTKLFIRLHAQELATNYPSQVDWRNVEKIIFISRFIMEEAQRKFSIPAEKCIVIPIAVALRQRRYTDAELLKKRDVVGMVGITPWGKRPDLALELFLRLKQRYPRLRMLIKGNTPSAYPWMKSRPKEIEAYQQLFRRILELGDGSVGFLGYDDQMEEFYERAGWVLSTSDSEGCHTAVAEGGVFGSLPLMLNWAGADVVYKPSYVAPDLDALEDRFDSWYANFVIHSRQIQREFVKEFGIAAAFKAWTKLLGL